jgi:hypothetical protein
MKPGLNRPESSLPESNLLEFTSIREPEILFLHSYQTLVAMGIRHDMAQQLASFTAFQGKEFDPKSPLLVHVHEEIGQEPSVQGKMAA